MSSLRKRLQDLYDKLNGLRYELATVISPTLNTKMCYKRTFGKELDLNNPVTLNEKILWLKLNRYMKNPLVIQCADKYAVREYIKGCGCEEILNELYGVYKKPDDILWDTLPEQFVIKWNFGAGYNIVCTDKSKLSIPDTVKTLKEWGRKKYWLPHSEMQYKYAPKRIVCEKLLGAEKCKESGRWIAPEDYKVYCFNGKPVYIMVCVGRENDDHPKFYFMDSDWKLARINRDSIAAPEGFSLDRPKCLDKLLYYSSTLSHPFPFVRADFYVIDDKVYFGELTFTPSGGLDRNRLPETDIMMGNLLDINYNAQAL